MPLGSSMHLDVVRADERVAHPVDGADEAHHELVRRLLVEVARLADLLHLAVVHDDDLLGDVHRLLLVVRHEDGRHVHLVVQAAQPDAQVLAHARVERSERLVEQHHLGLHRQRARKRHALTLAARQLGRVAVREAVQVDEVEQLVHPLLDPRLLALADLEPERDVVEDRHVLERGVVLEHEADAAVLRAQPRGVLARDQHHAVVRALEAGDHAQQRRLAAAARSEQSGQGALGHRDRHVVAAPGSPRSTSRRSVLRSLCWPLCLSCVS